MRALARPALLLLGLVAAGLALRMLPTDGVAGLLRGVADPARGGLGSAVLFLAVAAAFCAIGVPRQVVAYAAGFAFGTVWGVALAAAAALLGCLADFWWARLAARDWTRRLLTRRLGGRLVRLDRFLATNPFTATLMLRLLPVGSNLVLNLLAGVSSVALAPFLAASALGYLPQTLIFSLIGAGAKVDRPTQILVGVALFMVSGAAGVVLMRKISNADAPRARCAAIPKH